MSAVTMDTRTIAATLRQHVQKDVIAFTRQHGQTPGLVVIGFSDDPSTIDIIKILGRYAPEVNIRFSAQILSPNIKASEFRRFIEHYNKDPHTHAISLQLPIPKHLQVDEIASYIAVEKEVEGLHPAHMGHVHMGKGMLISPPALSAMKLLALYNINPARRHVVIVGRNLEIGRPLSSLFTKADATITLCHSQTANLQAHTRQAEILISAAGKPGLIKAEMVRPGAVVLDYGINYVGNGKISGDVDFEKVVNVAGAVTPMPGGLGPLTIIGLFENTLKAARLQMSLERPATRPLIQTEAADFEPAHVQPSVKVRSALQAPDAELIVQPPALPSKKTPRIPAYYPQALRATPKPESKGW